MTSRRWLSAHASGSATTAEAAAAPAMTPRREMLTVVRWDANVEDVLIPSCQVGSTGRTGCSALCATRLLCVKGGSLPLLKPTRRIDAV